MRKQQTVKLSGSEAEYQGLAAATQEVLILQNLICDLEYPQQQPKSLGEDNQSTFKLPTNPVFHKISKHTDMKQRFLRDAMQKVEINILHVPIYKMTADISTKGLCGSKFTEHREILWAD